MAFSLDGHVALVTGSSTGLGKITARNLAAAGAKVAVNFANNRERAEASFAEFESIGGVGMLVQADATCETEVDRMFNEIEANLGPVDIVVPNAMKV